MCKRHMWKDARRRRKQTGNRWWMWLNLFVSSLSEGGIANLHLKQIAQWIFISPDPSHSFYCQLFANLPKWFISASSCNDDSWLVRLWMGGMSYRDSFCEEFVFMNYESFLWTDKSSCAFQTTFKLLKVFWQTSSNFYPTNILRTG